MAKALALPHRLAFSTSTFTRGDGLILPPLNLGQNHLVLQLASSVAGQGGDFDRVFRVTDGRPQPLPSLRNDANLIHFDERPRRREEKDVSKVTGKSRGELYLEQAPVSNSLTSSSSSFDITMMANASPEKVASDLNQREVDATTSSKCTSNSHRGANLGYRLTVSSKQEAARRYSKFVSPDNCIERDGQDEVVLEDLAVKVTGTSRGEIFLEKALGAQDYMSLEAGFGAKKEQRKKREKLANFVARRDEPCCYGCGAVLQSSAAQAPGFIPLQTFLLKKKHHQLKTVLCGRCVLLSQGAMIPAVSGNGGYGDGEGFVSADGLRAQLLHLRYEKALVVKLVDIVDFNGSFLTRVRDLVGSNPIILVATKVDLLPKGTDMAAVGDWILRATLAKKLNVISIHLTSAKAVTGISGFAAFLQRQRQGRDVYVMGSANVGKSAFISSLLRDMGQRDPIAAAALRFRPIQSAMPGTTLGPIQIDAFSGGGSLYDTPGVHLHHRMAAAVSPEDLPLLAPRKRLAGRVISASDSSISLVGQSLFWGGLARVDVLEAPENAALTFYGPNSIPIIATPSLQAEVFYEKEVGVRLCPPRRENADTWPGLVNQQDVTFSINNPLRPGGDLSISGLGWVTIGLSGNEKEGTRSYKLMEYVVKLRVHTPKGVEIFMRPSIPVGANANIWYEYMEVVDAEVEASRPSLLH